MHLRFLLFILLLTFWIQPSAAGQIDLKQTPLWQAELYESQKNYQQAADMYLITARLVEPESRQIWMVKAAEMAWFAGNFNQAKDILAKVDESAMNEHSLALARLIAARMARAESRNQDVLDLLNIPSSNTPPRMQQEIAALREEAQQKVAPTRLMQRNTALETRKHWAALNAMDDASLADEIAVAKTPLERGWLELAYINRHRDKQAPEEFQRNLDLWKKNYKNHPASHSVLPTILATATPTEQLTVSRLPLDVGRIAVILPVSGRLSSIANVILDGITAARFENPNIEIRIYDSGKPATDISMLYQTAVNNGAELVIGPMQKNLIDVLASQALPVPVIAMNHSTNDFRSNSAMTQFGLNPEDEARQAARRMVADGYSQFAVLTPRGEWGDRLARAFKESARANGASVLGSLRYDPSANNHSNEIAQLLKPNRETNENELGADALFMVATPTQARVLVPLIKFHVLDSLPIYATSHAYSGQPDPSNDRDLNDMRYAESPWVLGKIDHPPLQSLTGSTRAHPRLFALGYDSLTVVPQFRLQPYQLSFQGLSGELTMDENNRIHRTLSWAVFRRGTPRPLPPSLPVEPEASLSE
ncbi:MAG: penicillin-binding protein activator [Thiotrichales bacterium]